MQSIHGTLNLYTRGLTLYTVHRTVYRIEGKINKTDYLQPETGRATMSGDSKTVPLQIFSVSQSNGPVECFGMTFPNDEARREYFTEKLREKLRDAEFRKIEGFPLGTDEDILAMSDPPYYTACPNPFLAEFVKQHLADRSSALRTRQWGGPA